MSSSKYLRELTDAMAWLGEQKDTLFLGQSVACEGTPMRATFVGVVADKLIEFPVAEDMQTGVAIGLAMEGYVPVSVYPRWNFLLLAANQLVNHLDRIPLYSEYEPKVIVRVGVGRSTPLDPGPQHQDDFTDAFRTMTRTINVWRTIPGYVLERYQQAYHENRFSTIVVEDGDMY